MHFNDPARRQLLAALGLGGLASFLPSLRSSHAANAVPRRIVFFYTSQGLLRPLWMPKGSDQNFELSPMLAPLAPLKQKLVLLSGLDYRSYQLFGGGSNSHRSGQIHAMTSANRGSVTDRAGGISIDQFIANEINKPAPVTLLPSLLMAIQGKGPGSNVNPDDCPCYSGPNNQLATEGDAMAVYRRLFPSGAPTTTREPGVVDPKLLQHRSALDFVAKEFGAVAAGLPAQQRTKLEAHGGLVRDMEKRLALSLTNEGGSSPTKGCGAPDSGPYAGGAASSRPANLADYKVKTDARLRLIQSALACDLTRVVFVAVAMPPIDGESNQHDLCHATSDQSSGSGAQKVLASQTTYFEMFAKLGQMLDDVPESDGQTLLDHTALVWCGQIANGNHDKMDHKWAILGKLGGHIRTGRFLRVEGTPHSNLWTSLANGMGVKIDKFGHPNACTGPLTNLS